MDVKLYRFTKININSSRFLHMYLATVAYLRGTICIQMSRLCHRIASEGEGELIGSLFEIFPPSAEINYHSEVGRSL